MTFEEKLKKAADSAKSNRDFTRQETKVNNSDDFVSKLNTAAENAKQAKKAEAAFKSTLDKYRAERDDYFGLKSGWKSENSPKNEVKIDAYTSYDSTKPTSKDDVVAAGNELAEKVRNGTATDDDYRRYVNAEALYGEGLYNGFQSRIEAAPKYHVAPVVDSWDKTGIAESELWKSEGDYKTEAAALTSEMQSAYGKYAKGEMSDADINTFADKYQRFKAKEEAYFSDRYQKTGTLATADALKLRRDSAKNANAGTDARIKAIDREIANARRGSPEYFHGLFAEKEALENSKTNVDYKDTEGKYYSALQFEAEKDVSDKYNGYKAEYGKNGVDYANKSGSFDKVDGMKTEKVSYKGASDFLAKYTDAYKTNIDSNIRELNEYGTDEQKNIFLQLFTEKGYKDALNYAKDIHPLISKQAAKIQGEKYEDSNALERFGMGVGAVFEGGIGDIGQSITGLVKAAARDTSYTHRNTAQQKADAVIEAEQNPVADLLMQGGRSAVANSPAIIAGIATGGSSLASTSVLFASAAGSAYVDAINKGNGYFNALGYGIANGAIEAATEKLFDIPGFYGGSKVDDAFKGIISKGVSKLSVGTKGKTALNFLGYMTANGFGEAVEEGITAAVEPTLGNIFLGEKNESFTAEHFGEIGYAALLGTVSSFLMPLSYVSTYADAKGDTAVQAIFNGEKITDKQIEDIVNSRSSREIFEKAMGFNLSENKDVAKAQVTAVANSIRATSETIKGTDVSSVVENIDVSSVAEYTEAVSDYITEPDAEYVANETAAVAEMTEIANEELAREAANKEDSPSEAIKAVAEESANKTVESLNADSEQLNKKDSVTGITNTKFNDDANVNTDISTSDKSELLSKLDSIGKSKGAKYEVLSVDWAKNGHDRTYLKLRETDADGKPKTYDYGYFDNVSGEYVPNKYRDINELAKSIPVNSENKVSDSENDSVETVKTEATDDRARVYNDLISRGVIKNDDNGNYVFNQTYKYDANRSDANRTDFSIAVGSGRVNGWHSETHSGTVIGGYGVSKSSNTGKYSVTHLQSGLSITSFDKQSDALQFASYVNDNVDYPIMRYRFGASVDSIYPTPADDASKNAINKLKEIKDGDAFKKESNNNAVVSLPLTNKKETFVFLKSQIGKDVLVNGEKRKLVSVSSKGFKTQNGSGDVITAEIAGNTLEYTDDGFVIKYSDSAKVKYQFPDAVSVDNGSDVEYNNSEKNIERNKDSHEQNRREDTDNNGRDEGRIQESSGDNGSNAGFHRESQRQRTPSVSKTNDSGTRNGSWASNKKNIERIAEILKTLGIDGDFSAEGYTTYVKENVSYQEFNEEYSQKGYVVELADKILVAYHPVEGNLVSDKYHNWVDWISGLDVRVVFSDKPLMVYHDGNVTEEVAFFQPSENQIFINTTVDLDGEDIANHELFHWLFRTYPQTAYNFISYLLNNNNGVYNSIVSQTILDLCSYYIYGDAYSEKNLTKLSNELTAYHISSLTSDTGRAKAYNSMLKDKNALSSRFKYVIETIKNSDKNAFAIANKVIDDLNDNKAITIDNLRKYAEQTYKGTLSNNAFTVKDMYDAMELGVNLYLISQEELSLEKVQKVLDLLPTQTNRTDSQVALQQFSTPPTLAYLANYAANVRPGETMLEPSAGIGGIALFAKHDGAKVYVNEYDKRRLGVLKNMPFDGFFNEDAEQLDNILGDKVNPSVIVMNPPFSSSEKRGMKGTDIGAKHISEALKVLADGGRLVAIVGQGMNDSAPAFRSWWKDIKEKYNVRANISIDGKLYKKYGTNFGIQMLVIDKTGKTDNTITESVDNLEELEKILGGIRDARPETNNTDSGNRKQNSGTASRSEAVEGSRLGLRRDTEASDDRNVSSAGGDTDAVGVQTGRNGRTDNKSVGTVETSSGENAGVQSDRRISDKRQDKNRDGERRSSPEGNTSDDEGSRSRTVGNDNGLRDDTGPLESDVGQPVRPVNERSESSRIKQTKKTELTDSIYEEYVPSKLPFKNAKKHPSKISESAAMSAIPSPVITYKPVLGDRVINDGILSDVQLEAVCYAGQSHEQILADGSRRGFFIGDGTGVGKGRTISGILLDNFNSGRKKAIWISMNDSLAKDASRDITALFGKDDMKFNFEGGKKAEKLKDTPNGIMFLTYGKLSQKFENDDSNFNRIVEWFGKDYDGVIVFDEAHKMANAEGKKGSRGMTKPSQTALAGIALQKALPKARIVYSSATGATDVRNLAYASRLGLWGKGTPFMNGTDFISKVTSGGIAAMELIARDLKSMGLYLSRNISYDGVKYEKLQHKLTKDQKQIYNTCAKAWQTVLQNVDKALKLTESDHKGGNRGNVQSAFWSSQQRFFNQIITSFQLPSVMDDIQKQLDEGKSCVIQLTSTNEAAQNREAERIKNDPELTLEDFDVSPKEMIIGFLEKSFPVEQYETQMDDRGNVISVPVKDSSGNAVLNREAVKIRDDLIDKLGLLSIPSSPIDQLINRFGEEMVAENTGRSRRIITKDGEKVEQKLSQAKRDSDVSAFQEGKKRIIVFSEAGGTGKSYHADRSANNQQQRIHYLLEAGWKADAAVQGFGRSHRSNQAITPVFKLVTTDLRGQMRFISTIAKRLDSLGAMTKGQRQAGSQGMFDASDNLENSLAGDVLSRFYRDLASNHVDDIENGLDIIDKLGITKDILDEYGRIRDTSPVLREMNKFLNRILTLEYSEQNAVFDAFAERLAEANRQAEENGTAERGLENYRADSITIKQSEVIKTDEKTGAETLYYNLTVKNRIKPKLFDDINTSDKNFLGFYKNKNSGAVKAAYRTSDVTDAQGRVLHRYRLENPASSKEYVDMYRFYNWEKIDEAKARSEWNEALKNLPEFKESKLHLISGVILPVWDKLPTDSPRIYRVLTDNGEMLIGRSVSESKIDEVLRRLGKNRTSDTYKSEQLTKELDSGNSIILDNGMIIKRRRVAGEWRYEISFGSSGSVSLLDDLKQKGVFSERVGGYVPRYFIPVNNIGTILDYITGEISPVSRITEGDDINKRVSEYVSNNTVHADEPTTGTLKDGKITIGMSDVSRAEILNKKSVDVVSFDAKKTKTLENMDFDVLQKTLTRHAKPIIEKVAEDFGIIGKTYFNPDIELEFKYSRGSLKESINKQHTLYGDFVKMLSVFPDVVENAVGIETHGDKYKGTIREDTTLKQMYVLASAFNDGNTVIPVKLEVKEFNDKTNKLYLSVVLTKKESRYPHGNLGQNQLNTATPTSIISIADLVGIVNPSEGDFLKYFPDSMLDSEQIKGKNEALAKDSEKVKKLTENSSSSNDLKFRQKDDSVQKTEATERSPEEWSASRDEENKADVKSVSDIIQDIRDRFDISINTGNYRGKHLGQFGERTESIRTRLANDLPTVSHELGHYLYKSYGLSKNESISEILDFVPADVASRYSKEKIPGEAVAEFVKRYLTSRESARVDAPGFFKDFENVLDSVGQLEFIKALASDVNAYMSSDLDVRYSKSIETARESKRKTRGSIAERVIEKAQSVYRTMVDDKADIKSALKSAGEYDESKGTDNAYILATNAANAYQRANSNLTFALSDLHGNIIGKSLVERIMPVQKEIGAFNEYLKLKHALEWRRPNSKDMRAKQVFADPILDDPANIENQIKKFEAKYPHFKKVSEDVYDFIDSIMYEYGVKSGLESEEVYDHLKKIYPHYVPFYRAAAKNGKAKGSFANQHSNFGYAKGSGLDTLPPLDNIVTLVNKVVASSVRNQAMNALAVVADTAEGFGNVMERVSPDMIRQTFDVTVQKSSLIDTLIENTNVDYNTLSDAINGVFDDTLNKFIPVAKGSKGIVTVRRGGANLYYQINDKDLYNAVASLSPTELKGFVKIASKINNFLKMGYTQYNPLFAVSNILKDFVAAWFNTDVNNFITYVGCYFQALKEGITQSDDFKRYMAMGGGRSSELNAEKKDLNKTFEKLMKAKNRNPVIKVFATVFNPSALNSLIEITPRFMEFKHQLKETGDANTAMFKADDITTNFKRHGTNRSVNAVFMFSNAHVQGLDKLCRSFKDATPKQRTARIIKYCATALILEALLAWWNMKDDEEKESYENLSDYIKNNNYVVSVGNGRYIKIPKPREHAVLSSAVGRLAEYMFNGTEFDVVDFGGYIFDNLAPAFVPSDFRSPEAMLHSVLSNTFLGGIADVGFNLDYKSDPIVSAYDKYKDDRDQYSGGTSKVAVALGNALDYSPKKINYLIENYTGWFGSVLSSLAPMDESYKDPTLGFKGRYISDSRYSTDVFNDMYDNVSAAEKRVTDEERFADNHKASADAYAENETMQLLGDFTTQFRSSVRNTLATEEEKRDAYFFSQQYIKGYDYTESEGLKFAKSLFEATGDKSVFITEMPITYDDEYSKDKVKYGMNLTPEQYMKLTNEYYDGVEIIRVDLSKLNISPERKVEEFAKRKREFTTNLRRKYVDEYGSRIGG